MPPETPVGVEPTSTGLQPAAWPSGSSVVRQIPFSAIEPRPRIQKDAGPPAMFALCPAFSEGNPSNLDSVIDVRAPSLDCRLAKADNKVQQRNREDVLARHRDTRSTRLPRLEPAVISRADAWSAEESEMMTSIEWYKLRPARFRLPASSPCNALPGGVLLAVGLAAGLMGRPAVADGSAAGPGKVDFIAKSGRSWPRTASPATVRMRRSGPRDCGWTSRESAVKPLKSGERGDRAGRSGFERARSCGSPKRTRRSACRPGKRAVGSVRPRSRSCGAGFGTRGRICSALGAVGSQAAAAAPSREQAGRETASTSGYSRVWRKEG